MDYVMDHGGEPLSLVSTQLDTVVLMVRHSAVLIPLDLSWYRALATVDTDESIVQMAWVLATHTGITAN